MFKIKCSEQISYQSQNAISTFLLSFYVIHIFMYSEHVFYENVIFKKIFNLQKIKKYSSLSLSTCLCLHLYIFKSKYY